MVDRTKLEELHQRLLDIQAEIAELKSKEEEDSGSVLPPFGGWYIPEAWSQKYGEPEAIGWDVEVTDDQNIFPSEKSAEAYRDAFSVMLELRRQPGSCPIDANKGEWYIDPDGDVMCDDARVAYILSPAFTSTEWAEKAIEVVGKDKIIAAYNTLLYGAKERT